MKTIKITIFKSVIGLVVGYGFTIKIRWTVMGFSEMP